MSNPGDEFESYVEFVYHTLLVGRDQDIRVSRSMDVKDTRGRVYNIDVYYEFVEAGLRHRVAIECKDTRRPVGRDDALAFGAKLQILPSTIGVMISRNGFQSGAIEYLDDAGILHLTGRDLPSLGDIVATSVSMLALPDAEAFGVPFWTLMEANGQGQNIGTYYQWTVPSEAIQRSRLAIPLFFSRLQAQNFLRLSKDNRRLNVVGLEQPALRFLLLMLDALPNAPDLMCVFPAFSNDDSKMPIRVYQPRELASEYSRVDLTTQFKSSGARDG